MKVFAIIGYTNSGKTTTILEIIRELSSRNYVVNTIKAIHIKDFTIDQKDKDSWRHRQAGATITATRSNAETAIMYPKAMIVKELIPFFNADYLVLEGFTTEMKVPKILCVKNIEEIDERLNGTVFAISGLISNEIQEHNGIRVINSLINVKELVNLIEKHAIDSEMLLDK